MATQATADLFIPFDSVTDLQSYTAMANQALTSSTDVLGAAEAIVMNELLAYMQDLAAEDIVPFGEESAFFLHLEYAAGQPSIPTTGNITAWLAPYVSSWAASRGYNPGPDYVAPPPPTLPTPSVGQTTVARGAREVTPSQVGNTGFTPDQAASIQAAIGIASADILKVQAAVIDAMLPNLKPGQVTQALDQLNTAATVLERQMAGVLSDVNVNIKGSMAAQLNGALEALHGLSQEVNTLAEQMATKADSGILDDVTTNTAEIAVLSGAVKTIMDTSIPDLANGLDALTADVGTMDTKLTNQIEPELSQVSQTTDNLTNELSGTDKECLDQLCDAINNVSNPIKEGGATPSLLKGLGNLLTKGIELGILATIVDALVTVADAPVALSAVVQDTELMSKWATSAAGVITKDYSWLGPLPHG